MPNPSRIFFLARHAKSSWKDLSLTDHDRPLNKRGYKNGPRMGKRLAKLPYRPEIIITSSAVRALTTAEMLAPYLEIGPDAIVVNELLYEAGQHKMLKIIRRFDNRFANIMLVGHNPGITQLANELGGHPIANIPTCGIVVIRFETDQWAAVGKAPSTLLEFDYPKKEI